MQVSQSGCREQRAQHRGTGAVHHEGAPHIELILSVPHMSDPVKNEADRLVSQLHEAARQAGLRRDDPMVPLIRVLGEILRFISARTARSDRIASDASRRIARTVSQSRQAADAETKRFRAALAKTEADTVGRIATAIVETADAAWTRRVRVFDRNTAMLAGLVLFAVAAACLAGGAWWGRSSTYADFHETEADLHAAFIDGPDRAHAWLQLMEWNDPRAALLSCDAAQGRIHIQDGRRWCLVPLWIEKPATPQPPGP